MTFIGKFDLLFSSHQLWHIFILIAIVYWHEKGVEMIHYHYLVGPFVPVNSSAIQYSILPETIVEGPNLSSIMP